MVCTMRVVLMELLFRNQLEIYVLYLMLIQMKIYNIFGNEITTLVNETKQPGEYVVEFNASNYQEEFISIN